MDEGQWPVWSVWGFLYGFWPGEGGPYVQGAADWWKASDEDAFQRDERKGAADPGHEPQGKAVSSGWTHCRRGSGGEGLYPVNDSE